MPVSRSAFDSPHRSPSARYRRRASAAATRSTATSPSFSARVARIIQLTATSHSLSLAIASSI